MPGKDTRYFLLLNERKSSFEGKGEDLQMKETLEESNLREVRSINLIIKFIGIRGRYFLWVIKGKSRL